MKNPVDPMTNIYTARDYHITGIVQGVGFRPFVFQMASRYNLKGTVSNTSSGVTIHIEGPTQSVELFQAAISRSFPPLAAVTGFSEKESTIAWHDRFSISPSTARFSRTTLISPDTATCEDCLSELFDPEDRRFGYPFINCTNCGPRYTIIDDIPYDRPNTSMKHFDMCPRCLAEYENPGNRRFHAQPNACHDCGPEVALYDRYQQEIFSHDPIAVTAQFLKAGSIVAVKGLGGFHLAADAENNEAVARLRQCKHREEKPLALMCINMDQVRRFACIEAEEKSLLNSLQRPIVILKKREPNTIAPAVAPRNVEFGVMLAYTPLHFLLLAHGFAALVMTSGNLSQEPISIENDDAFSRLGDIADYFLVHDRDIYLRCDDSIVRHTAGATRIIRRSRGYVPAPVFAGKRLPPILACGGELKNTVCLTRGNQMFLSQHVGDLENIRTLEFFRKTISHMKRILDIKPQIVAHDLHPDYMSTRYALEEEAIERVGVQHHHAHIVSAMTEHQLEGEVIGIAFDGTGYGIDGAIWGGEVMIADCAGFTRTSHLDYVTMPGGSAAIREPWRMGLSYLYDALGGNYKDIDLPLFRTLEANRLQVVEQMIARQINSPLTSSLGRLFDGVAAILGIRNTVTFEGQAAMELEMLAARAGDALRANRFYEDAVDPVAGEIIPVRPIISGILKDLTEGHQADIISAKFHSTLIRLFSNLCQRIRSDTGLQRVVLSGGVFQNTILLEGMISSLEQQGFVVFSNSLVPVNDGGISLGQAMIAAAHVNKN